MNLDNERVQIVKSQLLRCMSSPGFEKMNRHLTAVVMLMLIAVAGTPQRSDAEIAFRLEPMLTEIVSGSQVKIALILVDIDGDVAADGGLFTGGARLLVDDSSSATATITDMSAITPNSGFSLATTIFPFDAPFPNTPPSGFLQIGGFIANSDFVVPVTPENGEVVLGEFSVTVFGAEGSTVHLFPAILGDSFIGNTGFDTGRNFDSDLVIPDRVTISVIVPEPSSVLVFCGLTGVVCACNRRRRKLYRV